MPSPIRLVRAATRAAATTAAAALALSACSSLGTAFTPQPMPPSTAVAVNAVVVRVVDGDTVVMKVGTKEERVRLIGIDTPETVAPDRPVQCYGPEASAHTKELLPAGTYVHLDRDVEARDDYGRLLAYVTRATDGLFVNVELAADGFADALSIPPNTAHRQTPTAPTTGGRRPPIAPGAVSLLPRW
jgi:micrococcal nuclease